MRTREASYDSNKSCNLLHIVGSELRIATKGTPSPIQVGQRWVVDRTHGWMNCFGTLRGSTDKQRRVVDFSFYVFGSLTVIRCLIDRALPLAGHYDS